MDHIDFLLEKYNKPVPRYTSYPVVPYWQTLQELETWQSKVSQQFALYNQQTGISLYIHLPFCESLCTYCGCNKRITTNHNVEEEYIDALLQEWQLYCDKLPGKPVIRELHLGGGTPTFFSPANLTKLLEGIFNKATLHDEHEFSFEGHPNNTSRQHLQTLYQLGFTRVSYGVQDDNPLVQRAINRIQPFGNVKRATDNAKEIGYKSVNFDLIYGLPFQTLQGMRQTFEKVISLKPDRIAFYSYAHVPWKQKAQRLFNEDDLPAADLKMQLYLLGKQLLTNAGYTDIGMDHFALPGDDLYNAWINKKLHRNFMGYTTTETKLLLGLGVSAISDIFNAYAQNHKELENYYRSINAGELAITKGYFLTEEDLNFKQYILDIACKAQTKLQPAHNDILSHATLPILKELEQDKLITAGPGGIIQVTETGRQFTRNICNAFDLFQHTKTTTNNNGAVFSKAI